MAEEIELTVVMPCLNEAETLARCIEKALAGFGTAGVKGEELIADFTRLFRRFNLERGLILGLLTSLVGLAMLLRAVGVWQQAHFGVIDYADNLRRLIPASPLFIIGLQVMSGSFFLSVLGLKTGNRTPPGSETETPPRT